MANYDFIDERTIFPPENGIPYCPINPECSGSNNGDCYDVYCSVRLLTKRELLKEMQNPLSSCLNRIIEN